jgi:hypothetical protein
MRTLLACLLVLACRPALAQVVDPELFGDGHLPTYREEETDRRFLKSGIYAALSNPPKDAACSRVIASLLVAYADALPYLHRKDQSFYVDPSLLNVLDRTASSDAFPARAFLAEMIRRTMIDKRVPAAWIATSELYRKGLAAPIAVEKLKLFSASVQPIDSFTFSVPALLDRYGREVKLAPSVAVDAAEDKYRDKYMDRDVAWGGLILSDIAQEAPPEPPKKKGHKKKEEAPPPEPTELPTWAVLGFPVGKAAPTVPGMPGGGGVPMLQIRARLKAEQPLDLTKFVRGQRVMVKGHLWDIGPDMAWVEVRDAVLFQDPDWSTWPGVATAEDVRACPIAINDLSPYGFRQRPGAGQPDPFTHSKQ